MLNRLLVQQRQQHSPRHELPRLNSYLSLTLLLFVLSRLSMTAGHVGTWHKGMYCMNGTDSSGVNQDANDAVQPLYMLNESDWWFHHVNKCDEFPPAEGDFLDLPANGEFTVEHAVNRAFTTLSYNASRIGLYVDGQPHPGLGVTNDGKINGSDCISDPNIHTQNETNAAGTAFAISYVSDLKKVTKENLVVFSVLPNTPWRRIATYKVPNLPACPADGCICAWGWVPYGCGIPNMYMLGARCRVVGKTGDEAVAPGVPPVYCEGKQTACVKGAKQLIYWNQLEGNNVNVTGLDLAGQPKSPGYNTKMGFQPGAQTDIFLKKTTVSTTYITPSPAPSIPVTPSILPSSTPLSSSSIYGPFTNTSLRIFLSLMTILLIYQSGLL